MASKTSVEVGLLLATYIHHVETLFRAGSSTYWYSFYLYEHAGLLELFLENFPQAASSYKLHSVCAIDKHSESSLQSGIRGLLVRANF